MDDEELTNAAEAPLVCADCGALAPEWASINRGVIICSECCSVHRNLGRHISQIRSLKKGAWHANVYALVNALYKSGANNVWEHALIDVAGGAQHSSSKIKKKPVSNDPIIPKKEAFIKAKYVQLSFAIRPAKDDTLTLEELNKQLWCCVRTSHVETTLRLLALGADPNYADVERANAPLHVAAKEGQQLQAELLCVYGADVAQRNADALTPADVARGEKFFEFAARLDELEFEVTDRFSMFLCGRTPEHAAPHHQHFLIPELANGAPAASAQLKPFRALLQGGTSVVLERLVQDVYDEVDRREVCAQWSAAEKFRLGNHQHVAVFLPPIARLSATRNQLRQKLAKFDMRDFSQLVIDLLKEIRRRHFGLPLPPHHDAHHHHNNNNNNPNGITSNWSAHAGVDVSGVEGGAMDESRDYDEVADSFYRKSRASNSTKHSSEPALQKQRLSAEGGGGGDDSGGDAEAGGQRVSSHVAFDNYLELRERLAETNEKLDKFLHTNSQLIHSLNAMQNVVERLQLDQNELRGRVGTLALEHGERANASRPMSPFHHHGHGGELGGQRPLSPAALASEVGAIVMPTSSLLVAAAKQPAAAGAQLANVATSADSYLLSSMKFAPVTVRQSNSITRPPSSANNTTRLCYSNPHHRQNSLNSPLQMQTTPASFSASNASGSFQAAPLYSPGSSVSGGGALTEKFRNGSAPPRFTRSALGVELGDAATASSSPDGGGSGGGVSDDFSKSHQSKLSISSQNTSKLKALFNNDVFPDNLILETELLTGAIKSLLADLQQQQSGCSSANDANTLFHADSIGHHISRISRAIIPSAAQHLAGGGTAVPRCVDALEAAMSALSRRCHARPLNTDETVQAAYDVAKAAKQLLVTVHSEDADKF